MVRQVFAACKPHIFQRESGNILPMDYRQLLAANLTALMAVHGLSAKQLGTKATYLDGPKKGKPISERTVRNVMHNYAGSSALGLHGLGALAAYFGIEVYHLLVPGLDPLTQPMLRSESWMENEVERRVAARLPGAVASKVRSIAPPMQATEPRSLPVAGRAGETHVSHAPSASLSRAARRKRELELLAMYRVTDPKAQDELFAQCEHAAHKSLASKKTKKLG